MKIELIFETNKELEQITKLQVIRERDQKVEVYARYFFFLGKRLGVVLHYV